MKTTYIELLRQYYFVGDMPEALQKVRTLWASIPAQLTKKNKTFIYAQLQKGVRSKDYEIALQWLKDSGLVHCVPRIKKLHLPLSAYQDNAACSPPKAIWTPPSCWKAAAFSLNLKAH